MAFITLNVNFFFYIKRALAKGKQNYIEKKSHLSPDPAKKTVEEKKQELEV